VGKLAKEAGEDGKRDTRTAPQRGRAETGARAEGTGIHPPRRGRVRRDRARVRRPRAHRPALAGGARVFRPKRACTTRQTARNPPTLPHYARYACLTRQASPPAHGTSRNAWGRSGDKRRNPRQMPVVFSGSGPRRGPIPRSCGSSPGGRCSPGRARARRESRRSGGRGAACAPFRDRPAAGAPPA